MFKNLVVILVVLVSTTFVVVGQPVVSSAVNGASYLTPPNPSATVNGIPPIAQGSIFVVFGTGMGPAALVQATSFPLQTTLSGTSISVTSGGQTVSPYMVYTLAGQLAAILPSTTPVGTATLTVTYNNQTSKSITINVTKAVPGIFTINSQGTGPGVAQVALSSTNIKLNNLTTPGTPGSVMILYGTGLGPISGPDNVPPGAVSTGGTVTVTIGGTAATVLYAGRAPQFPGEDQINIQLPANVPLGCYTPAEITVNGVPSNDFVLSTATAGSTSCVHPFGLSQSAEATVDAGGSVNAGVFAAVRGAVPPITAEGTGGLFGNFNGSELYNAYTQILANFHVVYYPVPAGTSGSCVVYDELSGASKGANIPTDFTIVGGTELYPAPSSLALDFLTLSGPNGITQNITRAGSGGPGAGYLWVSITPSVLGEGAYTLSGPGGPDIAAFSATTQFPQNLVWTQLGSLNNPIAANGVTLAWTGNGTAAQPNVNIFGSASVFNNSDPSQNRGKSFSCIVPAGSGSSTFAVPSSITSQLPVASAGETAEGSLGISIGGGSQFNATLMSGKALDGTFFGFGEAFVNSPVTWH